MMNLIYDKRIIQPHYDKRVPVLLINEAPGPQEANYGVPLIGAQGGNLFRTLVASEVPWAIKWYKNNPKFSWPTISLDDYVCPNEKHIMNHCLRFDFLKLRARYIACTNSFPQWPIPIGKNQKFTAPLCEDVLADENIMRLKNEINTIKPKYLLICGKYAWLACFKEDIINYSRLEGKELNNNYLQRTRKCFNYNGLEKIWYLGHTRRWSMNQSKIIPIFKKIDWVL